MIMKNVFLQPISSVVLHSTHNGTLMQWSPGYYIIAAIGVRTTGFINEIVYFFPVQFHIFIIKFSDYYLGDFLMNCNLMNLCDRNFMLELSFCLWTGSHAGFANF